MGWRSSREFFHWRARRRLGELHLVGKVRAADPAMSQQDAESCVQKWLPAGGDKEGVEFLEKDASASRVREVRTAAIRRQIADLQAELGESPNEGPKEGKEGKRCFASWFRPRPTSN